MKKSLQKIGVFKMIQKIKSILSLYIDDILMVLGGSCLIRSAALFNKIAGWAVAGLVLIAFGLIVARAMRRR